MWDVCGIPEGDLGRGQGCRMSGAGERMALPREQGGGRATRSGHRVEELSEKGFPAHTEGAKQWGHIVSAKSLPS